MLVLNFLNLFCLLELVGLQLLQLVLSFWWPSHISSGDIMERTDSERSRPLRAPGHVQHHHHQGDSASQETMHRNRAEAQVFWSSQLVHSLRCQSNCNLFFGYFLGQRERAQSIDDTFSPIRSRHGVFGAEEHLRLTSLSLLWSSERFDNKREINPSKQASSLQPCVRKSFW